jgi:hypothetical protein
VKMSSALSARWAAFVDTSTATTSGLCCTTNDGTYLLFYSTSTSVIAKTNAPGSVVVETQNISLTMGTTGAFAGLIKYNFAGVYQWHVLFNSSNTGSSINNLFSRNNVVYVDLCFRGTFTTTPATVSTGTTTGTILLKVTSAGAVTRVSYIQ